MDKAKVKYTKAGWPKFISKKFKSKVISAHMSVEDSFECPAIATFHKCGHVSFVCDSEAGYGERQHTEKDCPVCEERTCPFE